MHRIVSQYFKRVPISVPLRYEVFDYGVNVLFYDFLLQDGRYGSSVLVYTEATVFGIYSDCIGDGASIKDPYVAISNSIRYFNTKQEWIDGRWNPDDFKCTGDFVVYTLQQYYDDLIGRHYGNFKVIEFKIALRPIPILMIYYAFRGVLQEPLVFILNKQIVLENKFVGRFQDEFFNFIEDLEIKELYVWRETHGCGFNKESDN